MENRRTSPFSPRAPNLLQVLPSRMEGWNDLCTPACICVWVLRMMADGSGGGVCIHLFFAPGEVKLQLEGHKHTNINTNTNTNTITHTKKEVEIQIPAREVQVMEKSQNYESVSHAIQVLIYLQGNFFESLKLKSFEIVHC